MIDADVYPDDRRCLTDLIEGAEHLGQTVTVQWHLQADHYGRLSGPFPLAEIYTTPGGTESYVDRADRSVVAVYAPGQQAMDVLESIRASIVGVGVETPHGYLDEIRVINPPSPTQYQSDVLDKAVMTVEVVSRPI